MILFNSKAVLSRW